MNSSPPSNPVQWFFNACLLILFGVVALSVAVDLLQAIWYWVLGMLLLGGGIATAVIAWRIWRKPW
ncbi:hypothetical protein [Mycobacterium sp. 236(2023)]|uniref:hypothetical protein n=1 Tax=Mycobacterium sp. 236(2023) TaxID=3038163 RepID=UPI0024158278|nr:hypothetical protein [Mycobacterium sp. 236(2023)]MDG4668664.1 hypothetical protein [Mycobacterium sp. 236(2023)]